MDVTETGLEDMEDEDAEEVEDFVDVRFLSSSVRFATSLVSSCLETSSVSDFL